MKSTLFKMTMGLGLMVLAAQDAAAQGTRNCAPRPMVLERLASSYGETRQSIGLGKNNTVVEMFASAESGSWSLTVTTPDGMTCLVASGRFFETLAETLPPQGNEV